ncbi:indole-3-glycerol phosphate synthase TrpC [Trichloromonas sp.]|uniref:indole-3-glycerol phosphate synthase TrpC n=1 Tax=Trichloromonas sp. TaxID=3069249 RepID=UPI003D817582
MILDDILAHKTQEVAAARAKVALAELRALLADAQAPRGFAAALRRRAEDGTAIIAEVKKGSPSKGIIRADFEPVAIARSYQQAGAACLSVLTDSRFFHGELAYLPRIAEAVSLPLLRKEFIVDPYQIYEARAHRADAVLLIAAALSLNEMQDFAGLATELGLDVLLEVHDEAELELALQVPVEMIGINNRNLKTFHTDLATTERLLPSIPAEKIVVAESGINSRADIVRLTRAGARAFLVGESLMREADIETKLQSLLQD